MKGQGHKKVKHQGRRNPYLASHFGKILVTLGVTLVHFFLGDTDDCFVASESKKRKIFKVSTAINIVITRMSHEVRRRMIDATL